MKKKMMRGACMLTSLFLLGEPLSLQAAEVNSDSTYDTQTEENTADSLPVDDTQDFLTAGIGDLFISPLTEVEYMEIARNAEGALWGYTHLGICNVEENNLNIRKEPEESRKEESKGAAF